MSANYSVKAVSVEDRGEYYFVAHTESAESLRIYKKPFRVVS